jgi:hypothetical protein
MPGSSGRTEFASGPPDNGPVAELIVVTGPPGAGKSTVSPLVAADFATSVLVAGDEFFSFVHSGRIDPWRPEAHEQNDIVTAAAAAAAGRFVAGGYPTVYDGVIGPWLLPTFLAGTGLGRVHYAVLLPPEDVCLARVGSRIGHGFTDLAAARHMYGDFARAAVAPRQLFTAAEDPEAVAAELLGRLRAGSLLVRADTPVARPGDPAC